MDSNNTECSFNKNGSCLYYDVIQAVIKKTINKIEQMRMKYGDKNLFYDLSEVISDLENLECKE